MIFPTLPAAANLSEDVPPYRVYVAPITPNDDPTKDPAWGDFAEEPRLKAIHLAIGSSVIGMSRGVLKLAVGAPITDGSQRIEDYEVLSQGDRVIVGIGRGSSVRMLWSGYCTQKKLNIDPKRESILYKLSGPEWLWGAAHYTGAQQVVTGQLRRTSQGDDDYFSAAVGPTTPGNQILQFTDEPAIFNPLGRKNMTVDDVFLGGAEPGDRGKCWEIPDRQFMGSTRDYASFWTKLEAIKALYIWYNNPGLTGINRPFWTDVDTVLKNGMADPVLRDINVDGLGLWEALRRVLGQEYGFYVDPTPTGNTPTWGNFAIRFFARGTGDSLPVSLNALDTPAAEADASIIRLEASKDIAKVVNRVQVLGKYVRHVTLQYHGDQTPTVSGIGKNLALQHGWTSDGGSLSAFATSGVIERYTIESQSDTLQNDWANKFTYGGANFDAYKNVFRLFVWNEAGEFSNTGQNAGTSPMYGVSAPANWWAPDLTGIADNDDNSGKYMRRRRPLLDTFYLDQIDGWRRIRPMLFFSAIDESGTSQGPWVLVKPGHYQLDHDRAAIWITVADLAEWRPFSGLAYPGDSNITDERNFATLLLSGKLRMMLEGSIETDWALNATADRTADSGSPFVREAVFRNPADYIQSATVSADTTTSPSGLTGTPVDTSADADNAAQQAQNAGQDQQVHSSITVSASWPVGSTAIGLMVNGTTGGRNVDLTGDAPHTRGAQIVGVEMDCQAMCWQLLTESAALRLRKLRRRIRKRRQKVMIPRPAPPMPFVGDGPVFHEEGLA